MHWCKCYIYILLIDIAFKLKIFIYILLVWLYLRKICAVEIFETENTWTSFFYLLWKFVSNSSQVLTQLWDFVTLSVMACIELVNKNVWRFHLTTQPKLLMLFWSKQYWKHTWSIIYKSNNNFIPTAHWGAKVKYILQIAS